MRKPCLGLLASACCLISALPVRAAELVYEPFDYSAGASVTGQSGGSGWSAAWTQDGQPCVTGAAGLSYTDAGGSTLNVAGRHADTAGTATTRNFRTMAGGPFSNVWVSFLYRPAASNSKFEGMSFYRTNNTTAVFSVNSPSSDTTARITLTNNVTGGVVPTTKGAFGVTSLVVLHLIKAGGNGGADRLEMFIDPLLASTPVTPDGATEAANLDFNIIRIAGQDGASWLTDEFRVGNSYADVTPHVALDDPDGDGLSNAQEAVLGLNAGVSDAALIATIKAHPDYFGLHNAAGILTLGRGGVVLPQTADEPVNFTLEVQQSTDLTTWSGLQTFNRNVTLPGGKNYLRVNVEP